MPEPLRCSLNVTFHFPGRPLAAALDGAVEVGFRTIELLDPYGVELDDLARALERRGLTLDLFNLPMGDFVAGERGFAGDPRRRAEFRDGVEAAVVIAERLGTTRVNALAGGRIDAESESAQYDCLVEQLAFAADRFAERGVRLMTELLNPVETPRYLLSSLARTKSILARLDGRVAFQLDVYHLQRTHGELIPTIREMAPVTGHYQIADAPGRNEPGSGEINFANVLAAIAETGYQRAVGCEYRPSAAGVDAFAWMDDLGVHKA